MLFPYTRLRRNRKAQWIRDLISEVHLTTSDLIQPLFIIEGKKATQEIKTMPGINRLSIDLAVETAKKAVELGIPLLALFPAIDKSLKSDNAEESYNEKNLMCRAVREIKKQVPQIGIMVDVALDPYTTHGHDGIFINGDVDNDMTIPVLVKQALSLARSGCDIVAPSDSMDGRIKKIRETFEEKGFYNTQIMSYAVKYTSAFYGPFREAVGSKRQDGNYLDKGTYQMDQRNSNEAMREVKQDIEEGADLIIIKPGLPYLDIVRRASQEFNIPVIPYQISGEYSMLKIAGLHNAFDYNKAMMESMIAFKRAGASAIITYAGLEIASWL